MRIGIFAKTFAGNDPVDVLAAARDAGYQAVQYNMACSGLSSMPDAISDDAAAAVASAARQTGLAIAAVSGTTNMIHPDPGIRADGLRRLGIIIEAAGRLGTDMVTLCTGTRNAEDQWSGHPDNDTPEAWRDLLDAMEKTAGMAERHGVRLGIEPELANVVDSAERARELIDTIASPSLRVVLDPANLFETATPQRQRDLVEEAVQLLADRIAMAHAKDRDASGGFVAAGCGVIDFPHFALCLRDIGFEGDLVAHGLTADEAPAVAGFLAELAAR